MAKSRDPFFKALDRIRERVHDGAYAPGGSIVIVDEARRLKVSTTPVREALSWLCGEGLVERGPAGGFLAARLDAGAVRDLYGFRLVCLLAGLDLTAGLPAYGRKPERDGHPVGELNRFFDSLVRRTGNAVLLDAYARVAGQIRQLQAAETRVFMDVSSEAGLLLDVASTEMNGDLRDALRRYHARRSEAAGLLSLGLARGRLEDAPGEDGA